MRLSTEKQGPNYIIGIPRKKKRKKKKDHVRKACCTLCTRDNALVTCCMGSLRSCRSALFCFSHWRCGHSLLMDHGSHCCHRTAVTTKSRLQEVAAWPRLIRSGKAQTLGPHAEATSSSMWATSEFHDMSTLGRRGVGGVRVHFSPFTLQLCRDGR